MSVGYWNPLGEGSSSPSAYDIRGEQAALAAASFQRSWVAAVERFEAAQAANGHCGWCPEVACGHKSLPEYVGNETGFWSDDVDWAEGSQKSAYRCAQRMEELLREKEAAEKAAKKAAEKSAKEAAALAAAHPFAALAALRKGA